MIPQYQPLVSICCLTYNHENYLRKCLDGFVNQKTSFQIEILVHEDASTDNTAIILKEYEANFPDLFHCVYQTENQFKKQNTLVNILLPMSRGKYIAICEGDDYWPDPFKLQKQVSFLEENPDYGMVHTGANVVNNHDELIFISNDSKPTGEVFKDLLKNAFIIACTVCIRNDIIKPLAIRAKNENLWYIMDYWFWAHCAMQSKVHFIQETTSSYRSHEFGISKNKGYFFEKRSPLIVLDLVEVRLAQCSPISLSLAFLLSVNYNAAMLARRIAFKEKRKFLKLVLKYPWLLIGFLPSIVRKIGNRIKHSCVGRLR